MDIGKETALFILKMSRRLKQLEHQSEGLHMRRNLAKGDVDLRVGNGARVAALAIGTYVLSLPSGLVLNLENCYFVPSLTKNIISVSCLDKTAFENQHAKSIKALRFDRGGEYLSQDFDELLKECRIVSQLTPLGTPQWNGVSERRNRTLLDMVRSMMSHTDLPTSFWGYALETTAFTLNRVPSKSVQKTPHEMWTGKRPSMSFMKEAVSSPDYKKWLEAMISEMDSMSENQVWTLVEPPEGIKPIGCKWVFKKKTDMDGNVQTYKGRLVAKGNATIVCKLQRSIYGLKQASRSWNLHFNDAIKEFGFIRNEDDPCVYKKASGSIICFLILYIDDILIIGNDIPTLQSIKTWLSSCFSMKDLGEATYILGVKIYRDRSRRLLALSQSTYIDKVLNRFNMEASKNGFLPMTHGVSLSKEMCHSTPQERERMSQVPYALAIGSIMYAMICTRPDLSYALSMTSRYQANPGEGHWVAVKNILMYLRMTKDVFLVYGGEEELGIKGNSDASFLIRFPARSDQPKQVKDYTSSSGYKKLY
ncbi:hypothetical protein V6N11_018808 [Hibiscus sabdariffa]|uniref:Integrase catalytic domain-containing protein n=1 Tax=Hibiscus sabdariffa TaxID=183260 RepID=A0ABR2QTD0_9ROSI